jgi:hypothetical protein
LILPVEVVVVEGSVATYGPGVGTIVQDVVLPLP